MEESRKQKIAFGLLNILAEQYYGLNAKIKDAISCISDIYSIDTNYDELVEVIGFLNEGIDWGKFSAFLIKKQGIMYDKDDYLLHQLNYVPDYSIPNNRVIHTEVEVDMLKDMVSDLKNSINDDIFTNKYVDIDKYSGEYNCKSINISAEEEDDEEDDEPTDETDDSYIDIDDFAPRKGESYIFNEPYQIVDDSDDEIDPMVVKRDRWGNLYTEGGRMWEKFNNKNNEDDEY